MRPFNEFYGGSFVPLDDDDSHSLPSATTSESSCATNVGIICLSQQWKIENFATALKLARYGDCLRGAVFSDPALPDISWMLALYPGGKRLENEGFVSLFLKMASTAFREVLLRVEYRFYFINSRGKPVFTNINIGDFSAKFPKFGHSWGLRNIPKNKVVQAVDDDGSLLLRCDVEVMPDINRLLPVTPSPQKPAVEMTSIPNSFVNRLAEAFETGNMSNCVLECQGQTVPVNTFVLRTHSPVFAAMFAHKDFIESSEKKVLIEGASADTLKLMLRYMYCGEVNVENDAEGLLELADRYEIVDLKAICEEHLCKIVSNNNAIELLLTADLCNCEHLLEKIVNTVRKTTNKEEVMNSAAWNALRDENIRVFNNFLELLVREDGPSNRQGGKQFIAVLMDQMEDGED